MTNLLDNAAKWSREGGVVEVTLHDGVVTVRDHGPGFKDEDLPFVFDRFHRAKDARSKPGSGLGLAIVRQAAEAHDGFVEAANAPDGGAILRVGFGPPLELDELPEEADRQREVGARSAPRQRWSTCWRASRGSWRASARGPRSAPRRSGSVRVASSTSRSRRVARDEVAGHPRRVAAELGELAGGLGWRAARAGTARAPGRARRPRGAGWA